MKYMNITILKSLDKKRMQYWIDCAKSKQKEDQVYSFISAWIGFNYFYSTYISENREDFIKWTNIHCNGSKGDKAQLLFLISESKFNGFFNEYKNQNMDNFKISIDLPILNMIDTFKNVPKDFKGKYKLEDLSTKQIFETIYQIRNNLFHGSKNPKKNKRDNILSLIACNFMIPFLDEVLKVT